MTVDSRPPSQSTWLPLGLADKVGVGPQAAPRGRLRSSLTQEAPSAPRRWGRGQVNSRHLPSQKDTAWAPGPGKGSGGPGHRPCSWALRAGVKPRHSSPRKHYGGGRSTPVPQPARGPRPASV